MNAALLKEVRGFVESTSVDKVFILADSNVEKVEKELILSLCDELRAKVFVIEAGEESKSFSTLESILKFLTEERATRRSLLICIGGGMTTDIGGFAAAIFKRGIRHINIATTLLAAVDAAVGGKTGIDFLGFKNEIGAFHNPIVSLFDAESFSTLPDMEMLSGFGEVIKTALISSAEMTRYVYSLNPSEASVEELNKICAFCRDEKLRIVEEDPTEKGLRKVLNMGHTAGHAIETLSYERGNGMAHGASIAHGNLVALILSNILLGLDSGDVSAYARWLRKYYPDSAITCKDYDALWEIARHDKKNGGDSQQLSYTLVCPVGSPHYDVKVSREQLFEALDIYQELLGR